jgi:glutaredoxin 3
MPFTEIYFTPWCPCSQRDFTLQQQKGVPYHGIDLSGDPLGRGQEMHERSGRRTVPQVLIGGYDDLAARDAAGELDILLRPASLGDAA